MIKIIPYNNEFEYFTKRLFTKSNMNFLYGDKSFVINQRKIHSTYIAMKDNNLAGILSLWINDFHPQTLYFNIIVDDEYRRMGIATELYKHIISLNINLPYLQCSFYENSAGAEKFLEKLGFYLYRTTLEATADLSNSKIDKSLMDTVDGHNLEVLSFGDIKRCKEFLEIANLLKKCYTQSHIDNPVRPLELYKFKNIMLDDLIYSGSYFIKKAGYIIAFSLMYENGGVNVDLGYRGVSEKYDFMRSKLIEILTFLQLEYAKKHGKISNVEIDDTDKWSMDMLNFLTLKNPKKWLSYHLEV